MMSTAMRHLPLEGAYNVRDLGGYTTADGLTTRWQTLLRADSLHALSAEAQEQLIAYGVRSIVDLRSSHEIEQEPNVFADSDRVRYIHIPLLDQASNSDGAETPRDLLTIYKYILDNCQASILEVMRTFLAADGVPALFHCSAGKDRTGIIAALMLGLAGIDDQTIAQDYALTGCYLEPKFTHYRQKAAAAGRDLNAFEALLLSEPQAMLDTMQYLYSVYGDVKTYLSNIGLRDAEIDQLRATVLEA